MGARYHPLYDGIWEDDAFDAIGALPRATFVEIAFFVFLFANNRQRPSGIYRVSDAQLATDTRLPLKTVQFYLKDLAARRRIVRDGAWIFVRGYLGRQPKHEPLKRGVERDILECSSVQVLESFGQRYPHFSRWSANRMATLAIPLSNGHPTIDIDSPDTEQSRAEHTTVGQRSADPMLEPTQPDERKQWLTTPHSVLAWLNKKAGRSFRPEPTHLGLIAARIASGITPAQLRIIVSNKVEEWNHEPRPGERDMRKYLRPATLFGKEKCEQYIGEIIQSDEP